MVVLQAIPKVVGSILNRAVLKTACGEHHTLALCTAPIEEDLSPDMVVWKFHEDEEFSLKRELARRSLAGVTRKHFKEVEAMTKQLIKDYTGVMKLVEEKGHKGGDDKLARAQHSQSVDSSAGAETGTSSTPVGGDAPVARSVSEMKADIEREGE